MEQHEKMVVLTLVALLGLAACGTTLPQQRPADLTIRMTRGGGHPAEGKARADELVLSSAQDSHYKVEYTGGGAVTLALEVTGEELDEIYAVLRDSGFDRMSGEQVDDHAPGTTVTIEWEQNTYTAHENGSTPHGGKYEEKWQQVVSAFKSYKKAQIKDKGIEMPATFDETLFGAACPVQKDE
jgi:hypothetical protein